VGGQVLNPNFFHDLTPTRIGRRGSFAALLAGGGFVEAWDFNLARERLAGVVASLGYFVFDGWSINLEATAHHVEQEHARNGLLVGVSPILRWHLATSGPLSAFADLGPGVSHATRPVPARGTRFNYLLQAGGGITYRLRPGLHAVTAIRWFHVSNNGRRGRGRNPDIQAVGGYAGLLIPLWTTPAVTRR